MVGDFSDNPVLLFRQSALPTVEEYLIPVINPFYDNSSDNFLPCVNPARFSFSLPLHRWQTVTWLSVSDLQTQTYHPMVWPKVKTEGKGDHGVSRHVLVLIPWYVHQPILYQ